MMCIVYVLEWFYLGRGYCALSDFAHDSVCALCTYNIALDRFELFPWFSTLELFFFIFVEL